MTASFYVLVSQELLDADTPWESAGLHLIEQGGFTEPGTRWCLFEDDNAPEDLNGKKVELTFGRTIDGERDAADCKPFVSERRVIA